MWAIESDSAGLQGKRDVGSRRVRPVFWILPLGDGSPHLAPSVTSESPIYAAPFSLAS